jgi:hypothetical protein
MVDRSNAQLQTYSTACLRLRVSRPDVPSLSRYCFAWTSKLYMEEKEEDVEARFPAKHCYEYLAMKGEHQNHGLRDVYQRVHIMADFLGTVSIQPGDTSFAGQKVLGIILLVPRLLESVLYTLCLRICHTKPDF